MNYNMLIGDRLREMRRSYDLSLIDLEVLLKSLYPNSRINASTLSKYENEKVSISLDKIMIISNVLCCSIDYLMGRIEENIPLQSDELVETVENLIGVLTEEKENLKTTIQISLENFDGNLTEVAQRIDQINLDLGVLKKILGKKKLD